MRRTASNWNIESPFARSKLLTNWSNNDPNHTIQLRDFLENQITRESHTSESHFFLPKPQFIVPNYYVLYYLGIGLDRASHETCRLLPPSVRLEFAHRWILLVDIRSRSLHVYVVRCLGSLAAAVNQAAPPHDLRRWVQHSVNLVAEGLYISWTVNVSRLVHIYTNFLASASKAAENSKPDLSMFCHYVLKLIISY